MKHDNREGSERDTVRGWIRYFGLVDWWLSAFTQDERAHILATFHPLGFSIGDDPTASPLIHGEVLSFSGTAAGLLADLAGWFGKPDDHQLAHRLLAKAEELGRQAVVDQASESSRHGVIDLHFTYQGMIEASYRKRGNDPQAVDATIEACEKQIALAPRVAAQMRREFPGQSLPRHIGFEHLIRIRAEQGRYVEALLLCDQASAQSWNGDWDRHRQKIREAAVMARFDQCLAADDPKGAKDVIDGLPENSPRLIAQAAKRLAEYYLAHGRESEALVYFQRVLAVTPKARGIRSTIRALSRRLGTTGTRSSEQGPTCDGRDC